MNAVETGVTIGSLLRESGLPRSEAELLLRTLLGRERAHLIAHAEEAIDSSKARSARDWFARRRTGARARSSGLGPRAGARNG